MLGTKSFYLCKVIYVICVWLRIVGSMEHILCFFSGFFRLMYGMLSVSLDCSFLIALSVFSKVYFVIKVFSFLWQLGGFCRLLSK
jgi:hypothetical protein